MIKYRKASEILSQIGEELSSYDDQGLIDNSKLYKILRRCNATLGEKINPEKQTMVRIENYSGRLPDDFNVLNYAFLCQKRSINIAPPSGFHVEYKKFEVWNKKSSTPCVWEKDTETVIYQKCNENWQEFSHVGMVQLTSSSFQSCDARCPNMFSKSHHSIKINKDGTFVTNFIDGDLFINYVGTMEDEDEDLMVIDHPLIEPYYEAAVINHIFKLLLRNKEADVSQLYKESLVDMEKARIKAQQFVNMPEYTEIRNLYQAQRVRLFNKFFIPITGWN